METVEINILQSEDCIINLQLNLVKFDESDELESSVQKHLPTFLTSSNKDDSDNENLIFHNVILHKEKPKRATNLSSNKVQNSFKELCEESCSSNTIQH